MFEKDELDEAFIVWSKTFQTGGPCDPPPSLGHARAAFIAGVGYACKQIGRRGPVICRVCGKDSCYHCPECGRSISDHTPDCKYT